MVSMGVEAVSYAGINTDGEPGISKEELKAYFLSQGLTEDQAEAAAEEILGDSEALTDFAWFSKSSTITDLVNKYKSGGEQPGDVDDPAVNEEGFYEFDAAAIDAADTNNSDGLSKKEIVIYLTKVLHLTPEQVKAVYRMVEELMAAGPHINLKNGEITGFSARNQSSFRDGMSLMMNMIAFPSEVSSSTSMTDEDIRELLFNFIDADGNAAISEAELVAYYKSMGKSESDATALAKLHMSKMAGSDTEIALSEFSQPKKVLSGSLDAYAYKASTTGVQTTDLIFTDADTNADGKLDESELTSYFMIAKGLTKDQATVAAQSVLGSFNSGKAGEPKTALSLEEFKAAGGVSLLNIMEGIAKDTTVPPKPVYAKQADGRTAVWDATTKSWKDVTDESWDGYLADQDVDHGNVNVGVVIADGSALPVPAAAVTTPPFVTVPPMVGDYFIKVGEQWVGVKKMEGGYLDVYEYDSTGKLVSSYTGDPHVDENGDGVQDWHFGDSSTFVLSNGATLTFDTEAWGTDGAKVIDKITISSGGGSLSLDSDAADWVSQAPPQPEPEPEPEPEEEEEEEEEDSSDYWYGGS